MAKNKRVEQEQTAVEMVEEVPISIPAPSAEVKAKVELIMSFFDKIHQVEGVTFDPTNADHVIIAAFTVGMRHYMRR
jgi:hypothetical protein